MKIKNVIICLIFLLSTGKITFSNENRGITMIFGGDVTLAGWYEMFEETKNDYSWPFARLPVFKESDIAMVNCENAITEYWEETPDKLFHFKMHPKYVQVFVEAGIDIVNLANNHVMDYGRQGLKDTLFCLDQAKIKHVGAGLDLIEARKPEIIEIKKIIREKRNFQNLSLMSKDKCLYPLPRLFIEKKIIKKIGFLGYGNWGLADINKPGVPCRCGDFIPEDIKNLKAKVDFVVVNFHWGKENSHFPNQSQISQGHLAIDAGADLVIGHHPHVIQGIEWYKGKPIVYSLGNLIFGGNSKGSSYAILFKVTIPINAKNDQIETEVLPIYIYPPKTKYQPYLLEGKEKEMILKKIEEYSKIFEK